MCGLYGGRVAEWLALLPHSKKVTGSYPGLCEPFYGELHFYSDM